MHLSAIGTLFVIQKLSLIGSISFGFVQNILHDFPKYAIKPIVALSSTNATKTALAMDRLVKKLNQSQE